MASSNQYPPPPAAPPPPQPPVYRPQRSIAGPLILIVIGLIFFLRNFGFRFPFWHWFGHWWPVLLILWGVIALIEHATAGSRGYRTRHLGAGGIVLLVLLVGAGSHRALQLGRRLGRSARPDPDGRRSGRHLRHGLHLRRHAAAAVPRESQSARGVRSRDVEHYALRRQHDSGGGSQEALRAEPERWRQI